MVPTCSHVKGSKAYCPTLCQTSIQDFHKHPWEFNQLNLSVNMPPLATEASTSQRSTWRSIAAGLSCYKSRNSLIPRMIFESWTHCYPSKLNPEPVTLNTLACSSTIPLAIICGIYSILMWALLHEMQLDCSDINDMPFHIWHFLF